MRTKTEYRLNRNTAQKSKSTEPITYMEYEKRLLEQRFKMVESQLSVIHSSKTFRWWQSYVRVRRSLYRILVAPVFRRVKRVIIRVTPVWLRKKVKAKLEQYFNKTRVLAPLDDDIKKAWNKWLHKRPSSACDVFIFSIIAFDYRYQRPQHLAKQLALRGHRVFYIENEFVPADIVNGVAPVRIKQADENIYKVTLSATSNLFIYRDKPSKRDIATMRASLIRLLLEAHVVNPVAKIDHPFWSYLLDAVAMPVIYDCMDEHSGFQETGAHTADLEAALFSKSDVVIATSGYLEKKVSRLKPNSMVIIKNAGDFDHFSRAISGTFDMPELAKLPYKQSIGYYGAIAQWFDTAILERLAKDFPRANIILIGHVDNPTVEKLAQTHHNICLLGEKPYALLPGYLQRFDVAIIPFRLTPLIKATSPVKIYEYLAAGKAVVATDMPELHPYRDVIAIAKDTKSFSLQVKNALLERKGQDLKKRQAIAKENTWTMRGEMLQQTILTTCFPKVSVIILSYNKALYTVHCLDSVLSESFYPNMEVIVVDNGSDKETVARLKAYPRDKRLRFIYNKDNLGFGAGNNVGLAYAIGEYLIVLNNDTLITPGWIERLVFHARPRHVGVAGPVTNAIGNEAKISISYDSSDMVSLNEAAQFYTAMHWGETLELQAIAAFCWIVRRDIYKKFGGFDPRYGRAFFEDDDYCMQLKKAGLKIVCAEDVFIHHYGSISVSEMKAIEYSDLFQTNKQKFEEKWQTKWRPHSFR